MEPPEAQTITVQQLTITRSQLDEWKQSHPDLSGKDVIDMMLIDVYDWNPDDCQFDAWGIDIIVTNPKAETKVPRYTIIGGTPFDHPMNRGATTFNSIDVVGTANTKEEVEKIIPGLFKDAGGLICIIDNTTGNIANL